MLSEIYRQSSLHNVEGSQVETYEIIWVLCSRWRLQRIRSSESHEEHFRHNVHVLVHKAFNRKKFFSDGIWNTICYQNIYDAALFVKLYQSKQTQDRSWVVAVRWLALSRTRRDEKRDSSTYYHQKSCEWPQKTSAIDNKTREN